MLGAKKGALSAFVYILLGAVGLPVLAGFTGGIQYFAGPTGGFLISSIIIPFPAVALGAKQMMGS